MERERAVTQTCTLLVVLLLATLLAVTARGGLGALPLYAAGAAASEGRVEGVVEVLRGEGRGGEAVSKEGWGVKSGHEARSPSGTRDGRQRTGR